MKRRKNDGAGITSGHGGKKREDLEFIFLKKNLIGQY